VVAVVDGGRACLRSPASADCSHRPSPGRPWQNCTGLAQVVCCEIRNVPTAVDRTASSTKILGFFTREVPIINLHGISVTAPYPDDKVHAVFDAGYFTLAPPTKVVPEVQQHPMWDLDST